VWAVPEGFETNLATNWGLGKLIIDANGNHREATALHDYFYAYHKHIGLSRSQADVIFLQAMKDLKVKSWRRNLMYGAVRLLGWLKW
jgi:hypothetical protein